jgi:2,3-bisphosphoglycerate-dependent phosphoglycerate mutase
MKQELIKSATKRVWIVRHGRSLGNVDIKAYDKMPCTVLPLTDEGEQQGRDVGRFFFDAAHQFDWLEDFVPEVLASPFRRAEHTAELAIETLLAQGLGKLHGGHIKVMDDLHEQGLGVLEGMGPAKLKKEWPEAYAEFVKHVEHNAMSWYKPPQGHRGTRSESGMDVVKRLETVFDAVIASEASDILIFAHGNTNRYLARVLLEERWQWADEQAICANTAVRLLHDTPKDPNNFQDYGYVYEPFHANSKPGCGGSNFDGYMLNEPSYTDRMRRMLKTGEDKHI